MLRPNSVPSQMSAVNTLSNILWDLQNITPERALPPDLSQSLQEHAAACSKLLVEIESAAAKYHHLDTGSSRVRRIWKRLKWEPEDIEDLRLRISSNTGLLNSLNGLVSRHSIAKILGGVDRLNKSHDDEEFLKVMSWFSTMDTTKHHNNFIARRQKDTGRWFLGSWEYHEWLESSNGTLFYPRLPGGGKTMIAASIIEDVGTRFEMSSEIGIAFIHCSYKRQHEQTLEDCLAMSTPKLPALW
ncbi:hypothetical protein B0T24DRAFT_282622 [Lasiosphaeria ovina]|uniref:Nephrocystin 3-like N-terminal domain-containing protein n=1 Tax=Lasiosphaeria ovina TaxID=92902 RepID=A0AAE0KCJ3_9PEZI|nr:hypothetical protein B0T24DRAFT_282622 [Lasiosphaeria ovina]